MWVWVQGTCSWPKTPLFLVGLVCRGTEAVAGSGGSKPSNCFGAVVRFVPLEHARQFPRGYREGQVEGTVRGTRVGYALAGDVERGSMGGVVITTGSPPWTVTPLSKPMIFIAIWPWS